MSFRINDMLQALSFFASSSSLERSQESTTIDYSLITPTVIAIGDLPDIKLQELVKLTQGDPVVIWNLGPVPLSPLVRSTFRNQVIDAVWRTPCQFTKAPLLSTIFSLCHAMKSWYDLNEKNITVIHCPSGQPNTGIVIACLLKYIGAFEHASHAYDFYCSKRLKGDPAHHLAPTYSNFFVNVDRTVDRGGYLNDHCLVLKTVTIAGLPLEESPCVDMWDSQGQVYASHSGWKADSSCSWNTDYGDGFFKISRSILGDFAIVCRFGGHLANTKDKSTLIFKYQNSTAFIGEEVLDLRSADVDINPQYLESIDQETFMVHLMFENTIVHSKDSNSNAMAAQGPKLPHFPRAGLESFEAGLDELSKLHSVVPDGKRSLELSSQLGCNSSERYISLALQLANNRLEDAERLVEEMKNRAALLSGDLSFSHINSANDTSSKLSIKVGNSEEMDNWELVESEEVVDGRCMICQRDAPDLIDQLISCSKCYRSHHSTCVGLRRIPFTAEKDKESRERYVRRHYGTWQCQPCKRKQQEAEEESNRLQEAALLNVNASSSSSRNSNNNNNSNDNSKQRSNLSQPTSRQSYSVATSGGGVVVTDKAIHMTNSTGQPMPKIVPSNSGNGNASLVVDNSHINSNEDNKSNKERSSPTRPSSSSSSHHPMSPNFRTKTDHVAVLLGLLSSAGLALEDVAKMEPAAQRELLRGIVQKRYPGSNLASSDHNLFMEPMGHMDLATAMQGIIANAMASKQRRAETAASSSSSSSSARTAPFFGGQLMDEQQLKSAATDHLPPELQPKDETAFDPRKHMLSMMLRKSNTVGNGSDGNSDGYNNSNNGNNEGGFHTSGPSNDNNGNNNTGGNNNNNSTTSGGNTFTLQGQGQGLAAGMSSQLFEEKANAVTLSLTSGLASTKVKDIPEYSRYFKMIKAGIDKVAIAEKAVADGVIGSRDIARRLLDLNPDEPIPFQLYEQLNVLVAVASHPKYERFFKMLKLGISKDQIKAKMVEEGLDPSYIDKDPIEKITAHEMKNSVRQTDRFIQLVKEGCDKAEVARQMADQGFDPTILDRSPSLPGFITASDHPVYSKYFKMLRVGLGAEAIKAKMRQENLDPSILDKDPSSLLPEPGKVDDSTSKPDKQMIPAAEHPLYTKYFKMLKVGLPKEAVKAKMTQEGINDTSVLDRQPSDLIPLETESEAKAKAEADDAGPQVKASEHPVYAKYFRMVKVGLPKEAVKAKMVQEGAKPEVLDEDPDDLIPLNDEKKTKAKAAVQTVPAAEHPVYSKYFKMLKVGLPKDAVKAKMKTENVDPSVLDNDPSDLIPLEEEAAAEEDEGPLVRADEHPTYTKFFKMLKVGLPSDAVKAKMKAEGADPFVLDKDPSTMIPVNEKKAGSTSGLNKAVTAIKPKPKKKKLHWKALDASKVHASSLWAEEQEETAIFMDEEEFKQLFVESATSPGKDTAAGIKKAATAAKAAKELKKPKVVSLVDMKRAQNGGIALARVKFSFEELREKLLNMHDEGLSADQLKNLCEYMPTPEETSALRGYNGSRDQLGIVERYMAVMMDFLTAPKHISIMLFKQQFKPRLLECRAKIARVQDACDDVRLSARLKRVLKAILKVGNQLNEGEENKGFSVESLLKLQTAKALDKKTTILQYVVMLIFRNDEDALKFPEDLKHVNEAARITMEMIVGEKNSLQQEFDSNFKLLEDIRAASEDPSNTNAMLDFFVKVDASCKELEKGYEKAKEKFSGVLSYFGEDPAMASHDFFTTLSRFVQEFVTVRESVDRLRRQELRKREQEEAAAASLDRKPSRRHTLVSSSSITDMNALVKAVDSSGSGMKETVGSNEKDKSPAVTAAAAPLATAPAQSSDVNPSKAMLQEVLAARSSKPLSRRKSSLIYGYQESTALCLL